MPVLLEMHEEGGAQVTFYWNSCGGDWAEMRVLQRFRGVRPQKIGLARGSEKVAKRILELLADGPMRPSALREAVGIRSRVHFSRCYMTPLVEKGLVARTDPDKPMSPRQEYKLA